MLLLRSKEELPKKEWAWKEREVARKRVAPPDACRPFGACLFELTRPTQAKCYCCCYCHISCIKSPTDGHNINKPYNCYSHYLTHPPIQTCLCCKNQPLLLRYVKLPLNINFIIAETLPAPLRRIITCVRARASMC